VLWSDERSLSLLVSYNPGVGCHMQTSRKQHTLHTNTEETMMLNQMQGAVGTSCKKDGHASSQVWKSPYVAREYLHWNWK
jgi:hypothetical protein